MSVLRVAEILELEAAGWTSLEVSGTVGLVSVIKTGRGLLGRVQASGSAIVVRDGGIPMLWTVVPGDEVDFTDTPVKFSNTLDIVFGGTGTCRMLYK